MKIDQNQRTQLIILCCLIAAVIGFGVYRVIGMGTQAAPKAASKSPSKAAAKAEETAEAGLADSQPVIKMATADLKVRDPFEPQVGPKVASLPTSPGGGSSGAPPLFPSAPTLPVIGPMGVDTGEISVSPPPEEEVPDLRLTGVIEGDVDVAIIRSGDNTRYIVREGQVVDGKFVVESISRLGVKLRYKNKPLLLKLGANSASRTAN